MDVARFSFGGKPERFFDLGEATLSTSKFRRRWRSLWRVLGLGGWSRTSLLLCEFAELVWEPLSQNVFWDRPDGLPCVRSKLSGLLCKAELELGVRL